MKKPKEIAYDIAQKALESTFRRMEIQEKADEFYKVNRERILEEAMDEDFDLSALEEDLATEPVREHGQTGKPLPQRIEELARGIISSISGTFAELQIQSMQATPASGFRRGQLQSEKEPESADGESPDLPEVVNWVPTDISSAIVGCSVFLSWKGRGTPSASPALTVLYDEEVVSFDTKPEGARGIEISIVQDTPSRFMIEITESGEYVVNLYSS